MRLLLCALAAFGLSAPAHAQGLAPARDVALARSALSVEAGGVALGVGVTYERALTDALRFRVGFASALPPLEENEGSRYFVPVGVQYVRAFQDGISLEGGIRMAYRFSEQIVPPSPPGGSTFHSYTAAPPARILGAGTVGARYETERYAFRTGFDLVPVALTASGHVARLGDRPASLVFQFRPSLSAGVRF